MQTTKTDTIVNDTKAPTAETRTEVEPLANTPTLAEKRNCFGFMAATGGAIGCCTLISLVLALVFPILQLLIGTYYRDQCPKKPKIPFFLYSAGIVGTIDRLFPLIRTLRAVIDNMRGRERDGRKAKSINIARLRTSDDFLVVTLLLNLFLFIWSIVGVTLTFSVHTKITYDKNDQMNYCHRKLYVLTIVLLVLNILLIIGRCGKFLFCLLVVSVNR